MNLFPRMALASLCGLTVLSAAVFAQSGNRPKPSDPSKDLGRLVPAKGQVPFSGMGMVVRPSALGDGKGSLLFDKGGSALVPVKGFHQGNPLLGGKGGPGAKGLSGAQKQLLANWAAEDTAKLSGAEKSAVSNALFGLALTAADRQALADLVAPDREGVAPEVREALNQAVANDQAANAGGTATIVVVNPIRPVGLTPRPPNAFTRRYVKVYNGTDELLSVRLQFHTLSANLNWVWLPADPKRSDQALVRHLKPGEAAYLSHDRKWVEAARIRVWAQARGGTVWQGFRREDVWLVQERDEHGLRRYYAERMDTYTVAFLP
jgi:hypothetical protein